MKMKTLSEMCAKMALEYLKEKNKQKENIFRMGSVGSDRTRCKSIKVNRNHCNAADG